MTANTSVVSFSACPALSNSISGTNQLGNLLGIEVEVERLSVNLFAHAIACTNNPTGFVRPHSLGVM